MKHKPPRKNTKKFLIIASLLCVALSVRAETNITSTTTKPEYDLCCIDNNNNVVPPNLISSQQDIFPYINVGFLQDAGSSSKSGLTTDTFIPITGTDTKIFFSNIKINNYSNGTFDGGLFFGYRFLLPEDQQLYGIYASLDFKKTHHGNYFNQITLGTEYWFNRWFFGASVYTPLGNSIKNNERSYEKAVPGMSAEIGYEFSKKTAVYVEGYYFNTSSVNNAPGVKVKLKQNIFSKGRSYNLIDKIDLEIGAQKDKLLGNRIFFELSFKIGSPSGTNTASGVAAHMTDPIFRSPGKFVVEETAKKQVTGNINSSQYQVLDCYYGYGYGDGNIDPHASSNMCPAHPRKNGASPRNPNMEYVDTTPDSEGIRETWIIRP